MLFLLFAKKRKMNNTCIRYRNCKLPFKDRLKFYKNNCYENKCYKNNLIRIKKITYTYICTYHNVCIYLY